MKATRILTWVALASLVAGTVWAKAPEVLRRSARPARSEVTDNSQYIDVNNIYMWVTNTGSFAWDKTTGNAGLIFPKGTTKTAVFAAGLWLGGMVNSTLRVAISEYSDEYGPGSAAGGVPDDPSKAEYKVYKLDRVYANSAARDAALADYNAGAVPHGAPVVTVLPDGSLGGDDPNTPEIEGMIGDQMMWAVYNDLDPGNHTNRAGSTPPLGVEIQQTTFAFKRTGALGNTVFLKYKIINRSSSTIDNMFVSQWSDPDLGGFTDDLVGCDISRSLGFVYNATNNDGQYGGQPPSVGYDFFKGPIVGGAPLPMRSFNKYINGTDPNTAQKVYNYMQGLDADGNVLINPVTGQPTTFFVSGDPVTGSGWLDTNPADRRLMLSTGPFSMAPGETQEVVAAIVVGQSSNRLSSISLMKFYDDIAQSAFEQNFKLASPPDAPLVNATPEDGAVLLTWDTGAESYSQAPYAFEGYVVYQGASIAGPFTRVATFDVEDGIQTVLDNDFDEQSGLALPKVAALGTDSGLRHQIRLTQDAVRGGPLHSGTAYYFKVTSYSVAIGKTPQVLESAPEPVIVVPQTPPAGVDLGSARITTPAYGQYDNAQTPAQDSISVTAIDPGRMIDASYRVGYKPDASGTATWYLVRAPYAATDTLINDWPNFAGDENFPVVDGIQIKNFGLPFRSLDDAGYEDTGPNPPGLEGPGAAIGLTFFNGGADYAANLFGSALDPADGTLFHTVEIRFTGGPPGQKGYRYMRSATTPRTYLLQDFVDVPWTVWNVDDPNNPVQLNAGWLENQATADGQWNPVTAAVDALGRREVIWPMASTYSPTSLPYYFDPARNDALNLSDQIDFQYALWPLAADDGTGAAVPIDAGDMFVFTIANHLRLAPTTETSNDYFTFSTNSANRSNTGLAGQEMDRIRAVPNPYFAHSSYELDQFHRSVKFTHLPARCTIRLFNLTGDLVRVIEKNDGTSQATWDLETKFGLPVGSGVYIFHVDAPGIGTRVGKVAIFMEKERLNNF